MDTLYDSLKIGQDNVVAFEDPELAMRHGVCEGEVHDTRIGELGPATWSPNEEYSSGSHVPSMARPWEEPNNVYMHANPIADPGYLPTMPGPSDGESSYYASPQDEFPLRHHGSGYHLDPGPAVFDPHYAAWGHNDTEAAFNSQFLQSSSIQPARIHSRMSRPLASSHYTPCAWGSDCRIPLDDLSPSGISRHLKEHHFRDQSAPWHPKNRGHCKWWEADGVCNKDLNYASFGKHIAAVHLQSTARPCPNCHQNLGRADSLERHIKNYCPRSSRAEKK